MTTMSPELRRALEDLLRRVLRGVDPGIDPRRMTDAGRTRAAEAAFRRRVGVVVAVLAVAALLLVVWFGGTAGA